MEEPIPLDSIPKHRGRPKGSKNKARTGGVTRLADDFEALLTLGNTLVLQTRYADYALQPHEIAALKDAIRVEAEMSDGAMRIFGRFAKISPHLVLLQALTMITVTRYLIYLNKKAMLDGSGNNRAPEADYPVPVGSGGTPDSSGGYGNGQDNVNGADTDAAPIRRLASVEN